MDPRQPQHPFSRNTASPYGRNSFPSNSNTNTNTNSNSNSNSAPYPPSSHAQNAAPSYSDHQRRPSDPPYSSYSQRQYGGDGPPMSGATHSRHQSSSSIGHATPVSRGMPPPSSPQQGNAQQRYGQPSVNTGAPSGFTSGRELPALPAGRPASTSGGSMSIHSILGGPPASREQPSSHYASPVTTTAPQNSIFSRPSHESPRTTAASEYAPFRRPLTPEHQRSYEPRDHRANSAGSPLGGSQYTPDSRRFGTPQTYGQRAAQAEERREPARVPNPNSVIPPRPSSQPSGYNAPPRPAESRAPIHNDSIFGRREHVRTDSINREPPHQRAEDEDRQYRPVGYGSRAYGWSEGKTLHTTREEREREFLLERARNSERIERERAEQATSQPPDYTHQLAQRNAQAYNRPADREVPSWLSRAYNQAYDPPRPAYEPIPEQEPHRREPLPGHDYARTTASQYPGHTAYSSNDHRYPAASQPASIPPQHVSVPASQYEANIQERQRHQMEQQQQMLYRQSQNLPYQSQESPTRRPLEETQQQLQQQAQRNFLSVQEINRKGRVSPLPQAVQGAQGQIGGPGGEPGIKSEFGRMFSGIGSGVGAMGVPSPIAGPQGLPNSGQLRREDLEGLQGQDSPIENGGYKISRSPSRGGRRRKLKEEDGRDDDSSTGRRTPSGSGRGKRPKTHNYPQNNQLHQQHHRPDPLENTSSPSQSNPTPFKNVKGLTIPSPPDSKIAPVPHHHHVPRHHHHHHHVTPAKPAVPATVIVPLAKRTISSQAVLDSVAHLPRKHLGYFWYQSRLKAAGINVNAPPTKLGFASTPQPLPWFIGKQNSTFTIKVTPAHLSSISRQEITSRKAVWGTDIYTDDSDVIAACIHHGWFRGEWPAEIDTTYFGIDDDPPDSPKHFLAELPARGPVPVPKNRGAHITVLILPTLEKYSSCTRFGIKSREWGASHEGYKGEHDGLSFMIQSVRWVDGIDGAAGRSAGERSKIVVAELTDTELEEEVAWGEFFTNTAQQNGISLEESFERGAGPLDLPGVSFKGIGSKSWNKKKITNGLPTVANNEEEIERVTERMIENANVHAEDAVDVKMEEAAV